MTAEEQQSVRRMARLMALLYYRFAKALVDRYGEEGKQLVRQVIWEFGEERGRAVREQVKALGLETTPDNYGRVPDLPPLGWEGKTLESSPQRMHSQTTYCPFAELWHELGPQAEELGLIYCEVDEAKYRAFDERLRFQRVQNTLSGGDCCESVVSLTEECS